MATQPGVWGIDLGQSALKAVRLVNVNGVVTATAFEYIEHSKILSQPDADPDQLTREALEKFLLRNNIRGDTVAMSIPGQSGLARFVKLPPVEEKKINDIVKFEAKQQIPFPLEEVVWDFQKIGSGVVEGGFAMETEIGLFAIKRETVLKSLSHFQDIGIDVHVVQMSPLALCNFIAYDLLKKDGLAAEESGKKACIVALDMGVEGSNLVITDGERIIWQRPIPIGGNRFTRALTRELKLTYAKAEHLKKNASKSPDLKRILLSLKPDLTEFVNEVQKSLAFFTSQYKDAKVQFMVGLGNAFRLPGLQTFLKEKLQLDVRRLPKFLRLQGESVTSAPVFNENLSSMGVAYGLALQGLQLARLQTNLLPKEIQVERLVKAKKPWAVAAAALLLLGTGVLTLGYRMEHDAVAADSIKDAQKNIGKDALDKVASAKLRYESQKRETENIEKQVRSIVAGQDERVNWLRLTRFVNECLPRSSGPQMDDPFPWTKEQSEYWEKSGKAAYDKWLIGQSPAKADVSSDYLHDLMQINLEGLQALYTDDLAAYFERLRGQMKRGEQTVLFGMPEADVKNPPKGAGWVVELRGYTYHQGQEGFLLNTLVTNLAIHAAAKKQAALDPKSAAKPDPVDALVSHPILYQYKPVPNPISTRFEVINSSDLVFLISGRPAGKEGRPQPPPMNTGGAKEAKADRRDYWQPIGPVVGPGAAGMDRPIFVPAPTPAKKGKDDDKKDQFTRTEFIVLFVWKEPVYDPKAVEPQPAAKGQNPQAKQ